MINKIFITLILISGISGCSSTSDGSFVLGAKGSGAWHTFASEKDIKDYWDGHETYEICMKWSRAEFGSQRRAMAAALKRRDENPMLCYNPEADALRDLNKSIEKIEKERNAPKMKSLPMPN